MISGFSSMARLTLLLVGTGILGTACGRPDLPEPTSSMHGDSGIRGPAWDAMLDEMRNLERQHPGKATFMKYGTSHGGADLAMLRIGTPRTGSTAVVIEGTIHGDEYLGVEDKLARHFLEDSGRGGVAEFLSKGGVLYITPVLNPDGYAARRRENNNGRDLNRDFDLQRARKTGFTQQETRGLRDLISAEVVKHSMKVGLTMDYHCCVGALIYPWGYSSSAVLEPAALKEHKRVADLVLAPFDGYRAGNTMAIVGYTALGASDDYYHEKYGALSFTFEGAYRTESGKLNQHVEMWNSVLGDQARKMAGATNGGVNTGGGVVGTIQASQDLKMAVLASPDEGSVEIALSASAAATMEICRGALAACTAAGASSVMKIDQGIRSGDRMIFRGSQALAVSSGEQLTILARDAGGRLTHATPVRLIAKTGT